MNYICFDLSYLPFELWLIIFSFLNIFDLLRLETVSKFFRSLSRNENLWKNFYYLNNSISFNDDHQNSNCSLKKIGFRYLVLNSFLKFKTHQFHFSTLNSYLENTWWND